MESCSQIPPLSTCFKGMCNDTICVCDEGWDLAGELSFFLFKNEASSPCLFNRKILLFTYAATLSVSGFITCYQLRKITKRKQLLRLLPFLMSLFFTMALSVYRLFYLSEPNLVVLLLLYALILVFCDLSIVIYFYKYLKYHSFKLQLNIHNENVHKYQILKSLNMYMFPLSIVFAQLLWIAPLVEPHIGVFLLRIGLGYQGLRCIIMWWINMLNLNYFIRDVKMLRDLKISLNNEKTAACYKAELNLIQNSKIFNLALGYLLLTSGTILLTAAIFDAFLLSLYYTFPIILINWSLGNFFAMEAKSTKENRAFKGFLSTSGSILTMSKRSLQGRKLSSNPLSEVSDEEK